MHLLVFRCHLYPKDISRQAVYATASRMASKLLDQKPLPDAILCANNYIAFGCVDAYSTASDIILRQSTKKM